MDKLLYTSNKELANFVDDNCKASNKKYFDVSVICKYDDAKEIIAELVNCQLP